MTDSVYFTPLTPYMRAWIGHTRYRGVDIGVLSGRVPLEMRERDLEKVAKELVETEIFDPARCGSGVPQCTATLSGLTRMA
jgi:methyl-coenzyme M reductase gamma subunit